MSYIIYLLGSENAGRGIGSLPSDFFSVSAAEVRTELQSKSDSLERESMLRTQVWLMMYIKIRKV